MPALRAGKKIARRVWSVPRRISAVFDEKKKFCANFAVFALFSLFGRGKRAVRGFFFYNIVYKGGRKTVRLIPLPPLYSKNPKL